MSSFVAHGLAGLTVAKALQGPARLPGGWRSAALGFALGAAADLDVFLAMAWPGLTHHRGPSHSLLFAAGVSLLAALALARPGRPPWRPWAGLFLAAATHPLLDWLMACGPPVPWLWPLVKKGWLCPVQLVPTAYYAHSLAGLTSLLSHAPTLRGLALEGMIFLPLALLACLAPRLRGAGALPAAGLLLAVSGLGVLLTAGL